MWPVASVSQAVVVMAVPRSSKQAVETKIALFIFLLRGVVRVFFVLSSGNCKLTSVTVCDPLYSKAELL